MFTQYKFSPVQISDAAVATAKALSVTQPGANPAQFAGRAIAERLRARPERYLQYGPYWWAVKSALRTLGEDFGQADDAGIRAEYGGAFPVYAALVAGEQFREFYNANFLAGTAQFWLDNEAEESYVLFDSDMEIRRLGGPNPLRVAADLDVVVLGAEAVLDDTSEPAKVTAEVAAAMAVVESAPDQPFVVKFEHEARLWTASVYALDSVAADRQVTGLLKSGRIARAIEDNKAGGRSALDSVGGVDALYVDRNARRVCQMVLPGRAAARICR